MTPPGGTTAPGRATLGAYQVREIEIPVGQLPFLQTVQVQPSKVILDRSDYDSRSRTDLISTVGAWILGRASPASLLPRAAGESFEEHKLVGPPEAPWLVIFPELFFPTSTLFEWAKEDWQAGSVLMTGLTPNEPRAQTWPFFDAHALAELREELASRKGRTIPDLENPELLDDLEKKLVGGRVANLAATVVTDRSQCGHLILHAKVCPSKDESFVNRDFATVEAGYLYPVLLTADAPTTNHRVVLLPLICSDFALDHAGTGRKIIERWVEDRRNPVDLVCVLNVQHLKANGRSYTKGPWVEAVSSVLARLGGGEWDRAFGYSHVLLTNVAAYRSYGKDYEAGRSAFVLREAPQSVAFTHEHRDAYRERVSRFGMTVSTNASVPMTDFEGEAVPAWLDPCSDQSPSRKFTDPRLTVFYLSRPTPTLGTALFGKCRLGGHRGWQALNWLKEVEIDAQFGVRGRPSK